MSECNNKQMRRLSISSNTLLRQWVLASVFTPDKHWSKRSINHVYVAKYIRESKRQHNT